MKKVSDENKHFLHADKHESLLQLDTMILKGIVKHSQSSQNNKFTMSLRYFKREVTGEVEFLHADKHQGFLQVDFKTAYQRCLQGDTIITAGYDQAFAKYSK